MARTKVEYRSPFIEAAVDTGTKRGKTSTRNDISSVHIIHLVRLYHLRLVGIVAVSTGTYPLRAEAIVDEHEVMLRFRLEAYITMRGLDPDMKSCALKYYLFVQV